MKLLLAFVLLFFAHGILNAQSTDPAGCVFEGSLYSDSSEVIIGLPFVLYVRDNGTGCQLSVQYATQTGNPAPVKPTINIRLLDDYTDIIDQAGSGLVQFTQNSVAFSVNRSWVEAVYEGTGGGAIIVMRDARTRFLTDESYATIRARFVVCPPVGGQDTFLIDAENGLYVANDTIVRLGGVLIENTRIETDTFDFEMIDRLTSSAFGIDFNTPGTNDTTVYWARRTGSIRHMMQLGNQYWRNEMIDTVGGLYSRVLHKWNSGNPGWDHQIFDPTDVTGGTMWAQFYRDGISMIVSKEADNPYYTSSLLLNSTQASIGLNESGGGYPGNGVSMGAIGYGAGNELLFLKTKNVDDNTATVGQFLKLMNTTTGEVEFATIDLSGYLPISDTAAMLDPYIQGAGTVNSLAKFTAGRVIGNAAITENGSQVVMGLPMQLKEYSLVGLPTGVTKDLYWITGAGPAWYQGLRVAYALESTASTFPSGRLIYTDDNRQAKTGTDLTFASNILRVFNSEPKIILTGTTLNSGSKEIGFSFDPSLTAGASEKVKIIATPVGSWGLGTLNIAINATPNTNSPATIADNNVKFEYDKTTFQKRIVYTENDFSFGKQDGGTTRRTLGLDGQSSTTAVAQLFVEPYGAYYHGDFGITITRGFPGSLDYTTPPIFIKNKFTAYDGFIALNHRDPRRQLDVAGEVRIRDLTTDPPTKIVGVDSTDGDLAAIRVGAGLLLNGSGVLSATGATTWLKTELEAGRDVDITGGASTDLRLRSNTRVQVDGKFKIGSDSMLQIDPVNKQMILTGTTDFQPSLILDNTKGGYFKRSFREYDFRTLWGSYNNSKGYTFVTSGIFNSGLGFAWPLVTVVDSSDAYGGWGIRSELGSISQQNQLLFRGGTKNDEFFFFSPLATVKRSITLNVTGVGNVFSVWNDGKILAGVDSTFKFDPTTDVLQLNKMGQGNKTAVALGLTESNYFGLATNGTVIDMERKRDTTIYINDTDYDFSAVLTTAQINRRYNRIIFWMTTTGAASSDSELTLHAPDANLMQCEYLIHSVDEAGGFDNKVVFGTNNAVDSTNGLVTNYYPGAGKGLGVRAGLRSGVYKYRYY